MKCRILSLAFMALALTCCLAADAASDEGLQLEIRAADVEGRPLPGVAVTVRLLGNHGEILSEKSAVARVDGRAFIPIPATARFTVSAGFPGWVPVSLGPILSDKSAVYQLQICMNPSPLRKLIVRSE